MRLISKALFAGIELSIGLYVSVTKSDPDVKYLNSNKRGCLFVDEVFNTKFKIIYLFKSF